MNLPPPEYTPSGMYVEYFEHKDKVCVMTSYNGDVRYAIWDHTPWMSREEFLNKY